ncbi:MAG: hypothetical protein KJ597_05200 [Nanoarchaeota archaeon]|nr:hypothetical protein [Nanoarchaeota archaeon]
MPLTAQDQILNFLRAAGPVLPAKVAKNINESILIASAHLADLVSQGKVKLTNLKVGGSPLYYLAGQEEQLHQFAAGNMNQKDYHVLEKLKTVLVLRENNLDTLSKVALRSLKDFAFPLHVTIQGKRELFWKWYLLSEQDTNNYIGQILTGSDITVPSQPEVIISEPTVKIEPKVVEEELTIEETPEVKTVAPIEVKEQPQEKIKEPKKEKIIEEPESEEEPEEDELAELLLKDGKKRAEQKQKEISQQTTLKEKKPFLKKVKDRLASKKKANDKFLPIVEEFFNSLSINVEETELIRKNSEIEFLVRITSVVGETTYFCKARKKKRCDEKDISAAYMQAQIKKLPLLFLYTEELTKKAQEMLESDAFKNALIKKIE